MQTGSVRTVIVMLALSGIAVEAHGQTAEPVHIPLQYWPANGAEKLAINVGINGGAPQPYVFDTGSPVFNAVYNPGWWPGLSANPDAHNVPSSPSLPTNAQFCLGGSNDTFCRGYTGNLVQVPSLSFYRTTSDTTAAATLGASPGYVVNAAYNYGVSAGTKHKPPANATLPFNSPPLDGYFYGTFGAGDFAPNVMVNDTLDRKLAKESGYYAGGILGQTVVSGATQGYVVAANGQPNPVSSVNGPQQANGINVTIGGQPLQPVSGCSPCVTVGLTPQMLGQFWAAPPSTAAAAGVIPWARVGRGTFPNPYGGSVGNNASDEMGARYTITLTRPGATTPSIAETALGMLDSGTPGLTLLARSAREIAQVSTDGQVNTNVVLTVAGATPDRQPIPGLTTTTELIGRQNPGAATYSASLAQPQPGKNVSNVIGISFFLQNSVMYDLTDRVVGYTPFFVTDAPLATTAKGPLSIDGTNVPLGLAGVVSGGGGVTIGSGGAAQLSAANSYTGVTTIKAGSAGLGAGQLLISGPGSIASSSAVVNDGVFDISRAWAPVAIRALSGSGRTYLGGGNLVITDAWGTYSGTIADGGSYPVARGGLTLAGGALVLSGANTYSGGTVVTDGAMLGVFADSGMGKASGGLTLDGGALVAMAPFRMRRAMTLGTGGGLFDTNGNNVALRKAVSGTGGLVKTGLGVLTLAGASSYTGGTAVNGGTLALAPGASLLPAGLLMVNSGGTFDLSGNTLTVGALSGSGGTIALGSGNLIVNQSAATELGSAVTGSGGLTMSGPGMLNLTGASTYTGPTMVSNGRLAVNGSITSDVTVGSAGNLGGSGMIFGGVTSGGSLSPGNSIGTLGIVGSLTQNAGATHQVEANAVGQADRIVVTGAPGAATINGGSVSVRATPGIYAPSTTYTILSAAGGVTGAYAGSFTSSPFLQSSLSYDSNNVYLTLKPGGFAQGARSPNQAAVGSVLDRSISGASGDFATVTGIMSTFTQSQGQALMDAISGQNYSGFSTTAVQTAQMFMTNFANWTGGTQGSGRIALAQACDVACDLDEPFRWGAWGGGLGSFGTVAGNANASGTSYRLGGFAGGLDYRFNPNFLAGVTAGYTNATLYTQAMPGQGDSSTIQLGLYGKFTEGPIYVDGLAGYAHSDNRMTRPILIPGLASRTAQGAMGADQFFGMLETGYRLELGGRADAFVVPFAAVQGSTSTQGAFTEYGAGSLDLSVARQTTNSLRTVFGGQIGGGINAGWRDKLHLSLRVAWSHEFADTARPVTASFVGAPTLNFTTLGATAPRDGAVVGFNASTAIAAATSIYMRYDGEIQGGNTSHTLSAGLRMKW
jgi:autotransporter-associated beta strand protein